MSVREIFLLRRPQVAVGNSQAQPWFNRREQAARFPFVQSRADNPGLASGDIFQMRAGKNVKFQCVHA